ncbi:MULTISPECIES: NrtA/SsuA/CpmA family ABC transporter substrate-binding protein [unclassified Brenneria]|uniref:taurine ABC transporter substrate-binding protein n=1 Tax=unclassified Brenneria TaxID=2634434 RepID=UPI0029C18FF8|nr:MULTISPECIES: NrtA/SsuA/CpmA family ABC transporter substrate-binding protein [unclassified Brenneria]MDX5629544.1 NrtA/SsuA/CpmA family ABC transporter substrate-binding protein [Brenneria sp. L3-3Z]MDX5696683.1 NrtA/SsuA/CpmA family ABC transporter substrate-binding protein [Brenneria sp. L4-2C]
MKSRGSHDHLAVNDLLIEFFMSVKANLRHAVIQPTVLFITPIKKNTLMRILFIFLTLFSLFTTSAFAQNKQLRVGYQTGEVNVLLTYAINAGLFEKQQIDVKLIPFPAGPAMLPALASKEIDLAWMGEFPSITGYSNGMPIEILMMERIDYTNIRVVGNPKAGIKNIGDLKGKKVGISVGSSSHYHLLKALAQAGLKQSDVTIVNLTPANMPPAYIAGQIDAAVTWEPNVGIIEKAGALPIATTRSLGMITGGVWVGQQDLSRNNAEVLQAFLRAWRQAQHDYVVNPKAVRQYEAKRIGQTPEEFDALIERQSVENPSFEKVLTADFMGAPGKELDSRLMKHLQSIGAFLVSEQRIKETPKDWASLFNTGPIQKVIASEKSQ